MTPLTGVLLPHRDMAQSTDTIHGHPMVTGLLTVGPEKYDPLLTRLCSGSDPTLQQGRSAKWAPVRKGARILTRNCPHSFSKEAADARNEPFILVRLPVPFQLRHRVPPFLLRGSTEWCGQAVPVPAAARVQLRGRCWAVQRVPGPAMQLLSWCAVDSSCKPCMVNAGECEAC